MKWSSILNIEDNGVVTADLLIDDEKRNGSIQMLVDAAEAHESGVRFTQEAIAYERTGSLT